MKWRAWLYATRLRRCLLGGDANGATQPGIGLSDTPPPPDPTLPRRGARAVFAAKAWAFRVRRAAVDRAAGPPRLHRAPSTTGVDVATSRTPLWTETLAGERALERGKVENLRLAAHALDGLVIPADVVFGFWRHVGAPSRMRGFADGRMLRQGCLEPVVGGGLCQLSNALYDVALSAGCTIVERHAHSRIVPGSAAEAGRDATVAWNYVDLRFAPWRELQLRVRLDAKMLHVSLVDAAESSAPAPTSPDAGAEPQRGARSCTSCGETACVVHRGATRRVNGAQERAAFLLDEAWPELQDYVRAARRPADRLATPRSSRRERDWDRAAFAPDIGAPLAALRRSVAVRLAHQQGPRRRAAEVEGARRIAAAFAARLTPDVTALTVAQSYLPHLWRGGHLGGREVTVLMTRLPSDVLQARLDAAFAAHPERATLADYRAPAWLAETEAQALGAAAHLVAPHAEVAALFGDRAVRLPWRAGQVGRAFGAGPIRRIAFGGPTIARKGAYAVRACAQALDLEVTPLGSELEGADFWRGVRLRPSQGWEGIDALVQPALVEDQPRRLLAALAAGVRVFASPACGLDPQPGLRIVAPDDPDALAQALQRADESR